MAFGQTSQIEELSRKSLLYTKILFIMTKNDKKLCENTL